MLGRRALIRMLAAGGIFGTAGCLSGMDDGRPTTLTVDPTSADESPLSKRWAIGLPGQYTLSRPEADKDTLYIGSRQEIYAVSKADGAIKWGLDIGALTHGFTPTLSDGTVFGVSRDIIGHRRLVDRDSRPDLQEIDPDPDGPGITAIDAMNGDKRWKADLPVSARALVHGTLIIVPLVDDETALTARQRETGEEAWTTELNHPDIFADPVKTDERIIAGTIGDEHGNSRLVSVDFDGDERWAVALDGAIYKGPYATDDTIYVGTDKAKVYAVDPEGTLRWECDVDGPVYTIPATDGDNVFVSEPHAVVSINAETGEQIWRGEIDHDGRTGLSLGDGMVHVGGNEIAAFDADGSRGRWRVTLPGAEGTYGAPLFDDGSIYSGACIKIEGVEWYDHLLFAFDLRS